MTFTIKGLNLINWQGAKSSTHSGFSKQRALQEKTIQEVKNFLKKILRENESLCKRNDLPPPSFAYPPSRICREALNWHSPIGWTCLQVVFSLTPKEQLFQPVRGWPSDPPKGGQEILKNKLLNNSHVKEGKVFVHQRMLNDEMLEYLLKAGYQNLMLFLTQQNKRTRLLLAKKEPIDAAEIIRTNIERYPFLDTQGFIKIISPLVSLLNGSLIQKVEQNLTTHVNFLKSVCCPKRALRYKIDPAEYLLIHLIQLTENRDPAFLDTILSNCLKPDAFKRIDEIFKCVLDELPLGLSEEDFTGLFRLLAVDIVLFQKNKLNEMRKKLWVECGDIVYGFNPILEKLSIFTKACEILDHSPKQPPPSATDFLNNTLFPGQYEISRSFSKKLYKSWWYLKEKQLALADRLIDWLVHESLVESKNWELNREETVKKIEQYFRRATPFLPFSGPRAESAHFSLNYKKSLLIFK